MDSNQPEYPITSTSSLWRQYRKLALLSLTIIVVIGGGLTYQYKQAYKHATTSVAPQTPSSTTPQVNIAKTSLAVTGPVSPTLLAENSYSQYGYYQSMSLGYLKQANSTGKDLYDPILFYRRTPSDFLYSYNLVTKKEEVVANKGVIEYPFIFSSLSQNIAYTYSCQTIVVKIATKENIAQIGDSNNCTMPLKWSPDGHTLLLGVNSVNRGLTTPQDLALYNIDTQTYSPLTNFKDSSGGNKTLDQFVSLALHWQVSWSSKDTIFLLGDAERRALNIYRINLESKTFAIIPVAATTTSPKYSTIRGDYLYSSLTENDLTKPNKIGYQKLTDNVTHYIPNTEGFGEFLMSESEAGAANFYSFHGPKFINGYADQVAEGGGQYYLVSVNEKGLDFTSYFKLPYTIPSPDKYVSPAFLIGWLYDYSTVLYSYNNKIFVSSLKANETSDLMDVPEFSQSLY